jgi:hypothetical protein
MTSEKYHLQEKRPKGWLQRCFEITALGKKGDTLSKHYEDELWRVIPKKVLQVNFALD